MGHPVVNAYEIMFVDSGVSTDPSIYLSFLHHIDMMRQIALLGRISLKRAYGNWTKEDLSPWEPILKSLAIHPVHQFDYVKNKNATDIAVVIDAMDLLHSGIYDGFALISSDSDFTPLAIRLKESGAKIIGCGGPNAPESLIQACDEFYSFKGDGELTNRDQSKKKGKPANKQTAELHPLLQEAHDHYQSDDGFALLSSAGLFIRRALPEFNIRDYGYSGLAALLEGHPDLYELRYDESSGVKIVSYKIK